MALKEIVEDKYLQAPELYNIYPIPNEFSPSVVVRHKITEQTKESCYVDTEYGRLYTSDITGLGNIYGSSKKQRYYTELKGLEVVEELSVPFRKIPVYNINEISQIIDHLQTIEASNTNHKILIRGQNKIYKINRSPEEEICFYGGSVTEPSFHPSYHRYGFDELFMNSMWHNQMALLLEELAVNAKSNGFSQRQIELAMNDRNRFFFNPLALGMAQHYGLPSVGLDLTDDVNVAAWFALHTISLGHDGLSRASVIDGSHLPTIFVFRCPEDAVFDHKYVKSRICPTGRPDRQKAWFGHVGWGFAKNQMATYLCCAFRLNVESVNQLPKNFVDELFPKESEDVVLRFYLKQKNNLRNVGKVREALSRVYTFG